MEQFDDLYQDIMSVAEYISKFRELVHRCELKEESHMTLVKFHNKLRLEIKQHVLINQMNTLEDIFKVALEHEHRLKENSQRRSSLYQSKPVSRVIPQSQTVSALRETSRACNTVSAPT